MKLYQTPSERYWFAASLVFGGLALAILLYVTFGMSLMETAFGERWVSIEILLFHLPKGSFGAPVDSFIQFKPITGFMILTFLWFATALQSLRLPVSRIMSEHPTVQGIINVGAWLICLVAGYEVIWNFMGFSAVLASTPNTVAFNTVVDGITFQYTFYPVNAVFATKLFWVALCIGLYTLHATRMMETRPIRYG